MATSGIEKKNFASPDETRTFPKGRADLVTVGGRTVMLTQFEPGFSWSECLKPQSDTELCETHHLWHVISGRIRVRMEDGTEDEFGPGDVAEIPPGHDGWTVGNEPVVFYDIGMLETFAR